MVIFHSYVSLPEGRAQPPDDQRLAHPNPANHKLPAAGFDGMEVPMHQAGAAKPRIDPTKTRTVALKCVFFLGISTRLFKRT